MTTSWTQFFENFPRRKLPPNVSRRQLTSAIFSELEGATAKSEGKKVFKLSDLGDLSDEHLRTVIPLIRSDCKIWIEEDFYWAKPPSEREPTKLFPPDPPNHFLVDAFNGTLSLAKISRLVAKKMNWREEKSFAYTRGVFLSLVFARVCFPANPLER